MSAVGTAGEESVVAWVLLDGDGSVLSERNADVPMSAASTIKLGVLLAVLRRVDAGLLDPATGLPAGRSFRSAAPGHPVVTPDPEDADAEFPADGTSTRIDDLLAMMIERSSNEATNMLATLVGRDAVEAAMAEVGVSSTRMGRFLGDVPAVEAGLDTVTTARDLARTMRVLVGGDPSSGPRTPGLAPASVAAARTMLARQRFPRIALELPPDRWWGSKSGDVPGVEHDVAAVGERPSTVLAVCTRGIEQAPAREVIRAVTAALRSCFTSL